MSNAASEMRRIAVVTAGAGAIAARLAPGHAVVVLDRTGDVVVDLGEPDDVRRAAGLVLDRRCDVLVHAANSTSGRSSDSGSTSGGGCRQSTWNRRCRPFEPRPWAG
jgi:hypothetical protein